MALPVVITSADVISAPEPPTDVRGRFRYVVAQVDQLLYDGYLDCADDDERRTWVLLLADWLRGELLVNRG